MMRRIQFSGWSDDLDENVDDIYAVANQVHNLIKRLPTNNISKEQLLCLLHNFVFDGVYYTADNVVGYLESLYARILIRRIKMGKRGDDKH